MKKLLTMIMMVCALMQATDAVAQPLLKILCSFLRKVNVELLYDPAILYLAILSIKDRNSDLKKYIHSNVHRGTI